jgi:hypothetical protein
MLHINIHIQYSKTAIYITIILRKTIYFLRFVNKNKSSVVIHLFPKLIYHANSSSKTQSR